MFSQIHHVGGRRLLLLAAFLSAVSWSGIAQAQPAAKDVAAAKLKLARANAAVAEAELELLQAGGEVPTTAESSSAPKTAAVDTSPKMTPPLNPSGAQAVAASGSGDGGGKKNRGGTAGGEGGNGEGRANNAGGESLSPGQQQFGGLEFGVGISFTLDVGKNDRITEAELVNGLVRVKDEDNGRARIMLESHYFFKPCQNDDDEAIVGCKVPFGLPAGDFGWGPFIALQPGSDNIIEAVAIGGMIGFRRPGEGTESFNLGLGVVIDPNTRILGDGLAANEPLPLGETAIRYKEKMQTGVLLLASFGF